MSSRRQMVRCSSMDFRVFTEHRSRCPAPSSFARTVSSWRRGTRCSGRLREGIVRESRRGRTSDLLITNSGQDETTKHQDIDPDRRRIDVMKRLSTVWGRTTHVGLAVFLAEEEHPGNAAGQWSVLRYTVDTWRRTFRTARP